MQIIFDHDSSLKGTPWEDAMCGQDSSTKRKFRALNGVKISRSRRDSFKPKRVSPHVPEGSNNNNNMQQQQQQQVYT